MAFPLNNAASATVIASLPFTVANTFGGVSFGETWFVYTATSTDLMIGVHLGSTLNNPDVLIFRTISLTATVPGYSDKTQPIQTPVDSGIDYYFKIEGETTGTATITLTIHPQPNQTLTNGQVWVPDPSRRAVFPPTVLDFTAQDVTNVVPIAGANDIDQLSDGTICIGEIPVSGSPTRCLQFHLYSVDPVTSIGTLANPSAPRLMFVKQDHVSAFYAADAITGAISISAYKINSDATLGGTWTLPGGDLGAFAVSVGGLIAYTSDATVGGAVGAYDLVNSVALSDFAAGIAGYQITSLTVLADDSVCVTFIKASDHTIRVIRYNSSGIAQATFNAPGTDTYIGNVAPGLDDPISLVLRTESGPLTRSTFWHIRAFDMVSLDDFTLDNFDDGNGHNNTSQFFGPSEAGTFIVFRSAVVPPPFVNPETSTIQIRRMRRTPHINTEHRRDRHNYLELLAQVGTGNLTGDGVDPQVILRWSDDGGMTWSREHKKSLGKRGNYSKLVRWFQLGDARDRVYEVVIADPVEAVLVSSYLDIDIGLN